MSAWVPFKQPSQETIEKVAQKNSEIRTAQRQAWAKSVSRNKTQSIEEETDFIKMVRATALKEWQKQDEVDIKEIRFSYTLVKNGLFSRIVYKLANPFSKASSQYRLLPNKCQKGSNNIEITFVQMEDGEWLSKSNLVEPIENEFSDETSALNNARDHVSQNP